MDDMILSKEQYNFYYTNVSMKRNGIKDPKYRWPDGNVPYRLDPELIKNQSQVKKITDAMNHIKRKSCIKFVKHRKQENFITIFSAKNKCSSNVGFLNRGEQKIDLAKMCGLKNIIHELLHSLGFHHMHQSPDRDSYLQIQWDNIRPGKEKNFIKIEHEMSYFGTSFDYDSIMIYRRTSFAAVSRKDTMTPLYPAPKMGNAQGKLRSFPCLILF